MSERKGKVEGNVDRAAQGMKINPGHQNAVHDNTKDDKRVTEMTGRRATNGKAMTEKKWMENDEEEKVGREAKGHEKVH